MPEKRRKYDDDFKDGAVRIVLETGRPMGGAPAEAEPGGTRVQVVTTVFSVGP